MDDFSFLTKSKEVVFRYGVPVWRLCHISYTNHQVSKVACLMLTSLLSNISS